MILSAMLRIVWIPVFYLLLTASCRTGYEVAPPIEEEYFAFGKAYGECGGNCATFFAVKNGKAYADDMNYFYRNGEDLVFSPNPLSANKYLKIKELANSMPTYLTSHSNQTFGCPDCRDQGLIYIEKRLNGQKAHWMIDPDKDKQPVEIQNYIDKISTVFNQL
jgi:hypothetical protein